MENNIEVLNRIRNEVEQSLKAIIQRQEGLKVQKEKICKELKYLYDCEDKLQRRRKVLQEIINDENLKLGIIEINTNDGISVGMDMCTGPDMTAIVKNGATITSPLYPGEVIATEIHMTNSSAIIAQGTAEEIMKQMERNQKHGKV